MTSRLVLMLTWSPVPRPVSHRNRTITHWTRRGRPRPLGAVLPGVAPGSFATIQPEGTRPARTGQVCRPAAAGNTAVSAQTHAERTSARMRTGPSMYEMEGPAPVSRRPARRLPGHRTRRDSRPAALANRLPGHRARRDRCPAALASRLPGHRLRRGVPRCTGLPIARPPLATRHSWCEDPRESVNAGHLTRPGVPRVTPEADPGFSSERFLRPVPSAAQGLSRITSRFFCHAQDARRLSPVYAMSPRLHAQVHPHVPRMARQTVAIRDRPRRPPCPRVSRTLSRCSASEFYHAESGRNGQVVGRPL